MHKLPVLGVAGWAYAFLKNEFGAIIRLSWLPFLIFAVVQFAAAWFAIETFRNSTDVESAVQAMQVSSGAAAGRDFLVALTGLVMGAVVAVALHRVILFGDRKPGSFVHIAFGKVEFLFVLLTIIGALASIGLAVAGVLLVLAVARTIGVIATVVLIAALILIGIYLLIRVSLVLPLAVATRRFRFAESWQLTKGNFWRLFGAWILVILPIAILVLIFQLLIVPGLGDLNALATTTNPRAQIELVSTWLSRVNLVQALLITPFSMATGALGVAMLSYSYKALSGQGPEAVLKPQVE